MCKTLQILQTCSVNSAGDSSHVLDLHDFYGKPSFLQALAQTSRLDTVTNHSALEQAAKRLGNVKCLHTELYSLQTSSNLSFAVLKASSLQERDLKWVLFSMFRPKNAAGGLKDTSKTTERKGGI